MTAEFLFGNFILPLLSAVGPIVCVFVMNYNIVFWNSPVTDFAGGPRRPWQVLADKVFRGCVIFLTGLIWVSYTLVVSIDASTIIFRGVGAETRMPLTLQEACVACVFGLIYGGYPFYLSRRDARLDARRLGGGA